MKCGIESRRTADSAHVLRLVASLSWLFVFYFTSFDGSHWVTWECNLPPRISETFACYMTLDV
jgi:hypothetical protein